MIITRSKSLKGSIKVPGDKSISHRSVMFGALAKGTTEVTNFLEGADCLSTISCFRRMGIHIEHTKGNTSVLVRGKGLRGLKAPEGMLDVGNSGTTMRLMSGILSGQLFETTITGDASIQKRPMGRIIEPLSQMGANISSIGGNGLAPLSITPVSSGLEGIHYLSKVASAQVKSSILLAGLYAKGPTSVTEPYVSRNHTEIMLKSMGADIISKDTTVTLQPGAELRGNRIEVPGDISSAAYFIAAGLLVPGSEILIKNVGINPTRDGIIRVIKAMGADFEILDIRNTDSEATADIFVRHSNLKATEIGGDIIPTLIDEIPVIAVMACFAEGTTIIRDAAELKVKESNRIDVMVKNLSLLGAKVQATEDGMVITGGSSLKGTIIDSMEDHRIAMSFAIAGLLADGETSILNAECVNISYPGFYDDLKKLAQ
ncbi:3-phosphoshikimate 1-carboxyvinyltransferase [Anaerocolumna sp. AGMB13020]|uniref:3-phosphoshikimate 1-carboxyvinyltransferase n=1 Tax=Anaerocolumna sp. AGMB13020 TaxID=3081750 RepID=UPI00295491B0|nr:3-phosphoshikimate 1-carboxyvinyltransferase [Anaerocolumna sp. AGMB13020]WOO37338.1 3-phosphoshikimate 1-carboxyvinyltransferase [Anaerocolumna sp. AGMB13020]